MNDRPPFDSDSAPAEAARETVSRPTACEPPPAAGAVRFPDVAQNPASREKVLARERAVLRVQHLVSCGTAYAAALRLASLEHAVSTRSLRRWVAGYQRDGLDGLTEQRLGRVGRKSVVSVLERFAPHIIDHARAASIEHGTLGPRGEQNIARAVRNVIARHPDLPAVAREFLHGGHASKSYVPPSLRTALRVSPQARDLLEGPHAEKLRGPWSLHDFSGVRAGQIAVGDDMTANVYCWQEWPGAQGYIVFRPQILAWLDVGCLGFLTARALVRTCGDDLKHRALSGYTADDVWGTFGDLTDEWGLYPEVVLEGGAWSSAKVRGHRTGLPHDTRIGGLESLGVKVRRAYSPRAKAIEERFIQLQYELDAFPGYCGRRERDDRPEAIDAILAACKSGKAHPGQCGLPHFTRDFIPHLQRSLLALWGERNDGQLLRGRTPAEKWEEDAPQLGQMSATAKHLYRSDFSLVSVQRNGQIVLTDGTGKFQSRFLYRSAETLLPLAGQRVGVYWNSGRPETDACIVRVLDRQFLGCAQYVDPLPRYSATREQLRADGQARAEYHRLARAETVNLRPHLQRTYRFTPPTIESSRPAPRAQHPSAVERELVAAESRTREHTLVQARADAVDTDTLLARRAARLKPDE